MRESKTVLIVAVLLLAVTGFCIYHVTPRVGHHSEIKIESPCEKEYKKYVWMEANAFIYLTKKL